ncbi:MAG: hypothetical protein ACRC5H_10470 [Treponemataceae bacterium]
MQIYTSYFKKMAGREKGENDCYISVARTKPFWIAKKIDADWGELFGNFGELEDYKESLIDETIQDAGDFFMQDDLQKADELNLFLLCHENTKKKPCHRTLLAEVFKDKFGLNIKEFEGD